MGIVNCADEQFGYVDGDPAFVRHLGNDWDKGIYKLSLRVLKEAGGAAGRPTGSRSDWRMITIRAPEERAAGRPAGAGATPPAMHPPGVRPSA